MRFPRVKAEGQSFYHCVSRVVDGRFIFQTTGHGSVEAERFLQLMRRLEAFSGVVILNYALMANHFHLLCEVPEPRTLSEAELLQRVEAGFGPGRREALEQQLARWRQQPDGLDQIQRLLEPYRRRMYVISILIRFVPVCVPTLRIIVTAAMRRRSPPIRLWLARASEPYWINRRRFPGTKSVGNIASTCF